MNVICLEDEAFYTLVEQVIDRLSQNSNVQVEKWIPEEKAKQILNIKSKTTLQKLRDEGRIRFSQPQKKIILYDRDSIEEYLNKHSRNTF